MAITFKRNSYDVRYTIENPTPDLIENAIKIVINGNSIQPTDLNRQYELMRAVIEAYDKYGVHFDKQAAAEKLIRPIFEDPFKTRKVELLNLAGLILKNDAAIKEIYARIEGEPYTNNRSTPPDPQILPMAIETILSRIKIQLLQEQENADRDHLKNLIAWHKKFNTPFEKQALGQTLIEAIFPNPTKKSYLYTLAALFLEHDELRELYSRLQEKWDAALLVEMQDLSKLHISTQPVIVSIFGGPVKELAETVEWITSNGPGKEEKKAIHTALAALMDAFADFKNQLDRPAYLQQLIEQIEKNSDNPAEELIKTHTHLNLKALAGVYIAEALFRSGEQLLQKFCLLSIKIDNSSVLFAEICTKIAAFSEYEPSADEKPVSLNELNLTADQLMEEIYRLSTVKQKFAKLYDVICEKTASLREISLAEVSSEIARSLAEKTEDPIENRHYLNISLAFDNTPFTSMEDHLLTPMNVDDPENYYSEQESVGPLPDSLPPRRSFSH